MSRAQRRQALRPLPSKPILGSPAIAVCLPTRGNVTIETMMSITGHMDGLPYTMLTASRMSVVDARNTLARKALELEQSASFTPTEWFVLWVDSDAFWRPGTVKRAVQTLLDSPEIDVLSGWFSPRSPWSGPAVRYENGSWPRPGTDCEFGEIVEIHRTGFHFVLHRLSVLKRLGEAPFSLRDGDEAEDFAFSRRCRESGLKIWVNTDLPVAHIDDEGNAFLPGEPVHRVVGRELLKSVQPTNRSYGIEVDNALNPQVKTVRIS